MYIIRKACARRVTILNVAAHFGALLLMGCCLVISLSSRALLELVPSPSTDLGLNCTPLAPSAGAVVHWPATTRPFVLPSENPLGLAAIWRAQLCSGGGARDFFPEGMQHAPHEYLAAVPPLTRIRCVGLSCRGAIVVERLAGCPVARACRSGAARPRDCAGPAFAEPPPAEMVEDAWDLGPDEFYLVLEGPEFLKPRGVHVGGCRYVFSFFLTLPGAYRIYLLALRSDWGALNETGGALSTLPFPAGVGGCDANFVCTETKGYAEFGGRRLHHAPEHPFHLSHFPPYTLDNLLGDKLVVRLGGSRSTASNDEDARALALREASQCTEPGALPLCRVGAAAGRWVRRTSTARDFDASSPPWMVEERRFYNGGYGLGIRYFTDLGQSVEWVPYACCPRALVKERVWACMANASSTIQLRGDSQMRVLFNSFVAEACDSPDRSVAHGINGQACTSPSARCGKWQTCYRFDPIGKAFDFNAAAMSTVVNFGQWSASGGRQSTLALWSLEVRRWAALALRSRTPQRRVFWMDIVPYPQGNFDWFYTYRDWRTSHRVALFHAQSMRVLAPLVQRGELDGIISRFDVTDPLVDMAKDGAHVENTRVLAEANRRVIVALCGADVLGA